MVVVLVLLGCLAGVSSAASTLPDGRVYEEVTPPRPIEKNGTGVSGSEQNMLYSSPDGNATTYASLSGAGDTESSVGFPIYVARRGETAWTSSGLNPPASTGALAAGLGYTEDLSGSYFVGYEPFSAGGGSGLYLWEPTGNGLTTIASNVGTENRPPNTTAIASEAPDGNTVLFEASAKLTPDAIEGVSNVYLWNKVTGKITLVNVLPDDSVPSGGAYAGPWNYLEEIAEQGGSSSSYYTKESYSRDASRVFFTDANALQLYMRENPESSSATTTWISKSQKTNGAGPGGTDPLGPKPASYLQATPDGSFVFFKSHEELTNDANTGAADEGEDLYRYDVESGELIDITPDEAENLPEGARVVGLVGISEDASFAYFIARGVLAAGATEGETNLYVWHEGQIDFITTVSPFDEEVWRNNRQSGGSLLKQKASRVSPDGETLLFSALGPLGGSNSPPFVSEVYRWEYKGSGIDCLSCQPDGTATETAAFFQQTPEVALQAQMAGSITTRSLSADGTRAFFVTSEPLVAQDVNNAQDVYEWEAPGKGSCASASENGGCLYLISTGTSPEPSFFSEASTSGDDVFFFTSQRLVGQDKDEFYDVYDARVGGGLSLQNADPPRPCEGEGCLGGATVASPEQARGSSSFAGPGNPKPRTCKKGFRKVIRKGKERCVKTHHRRRHTKRKHHAAIRGDR